MKNNLDIVNFKQRDEILGPYRVEPLGSKCGGIYHFSNMPYTVLRRLLDLQFIDLEDNQNDSPTNGEMIEFIEQHPGFTGHGYAVTPDRDDYRISLEGCDFVGRHTKQYLIDFIHLFRMADDFIVENDRLYCWFD